MADERTRKARLLHVEGLVYGTPLAVSRERLDTILAVLERRAQGDETPQATGADDEDAPRSDKPELTVTAEGIAILPVMGTFVKRAGMIDALSGLQSYGAIERQFRALVHDPSVRGILLQVDSPGGQVSGMLDLARYVRSATQAKTVWAIADDLACSAAYAIASGAERVLVTETGFVGSIGAIAARRDVSAASVAAGARTEFFTSGAFKTDGNPEVALTDPERQRLQAKVDQMGALFHALVAAHRPGLSVEAIAAQQAGTFMGQKAVDAGLADGVATLAQAVAELTAYVTARAQQQPAGRRMSAAAPSTAGRMSMETQNNSSNVVSLEEHRAGVAEARATATAEFKARAVQITNLCMLAGCPTKAAEFIASEMTVEQISAALVDAKAQASVAEVQPMAPQALGTGSSPRLDVAGIYAARQAAIDEAHAKRPAPSRVA